MPSLRTALDLLRHDRALFYKRVVANACRLMEAPLAFARGEKPLYRDIIPTPPPEGIQRRFLTVFGCNPFLPSGIATSLRAQCSLLKGMGYAVDGVFYVQDEISRDSREALLRFFDRATILFPQTARQDRLADGVTAPNLDIWCGQELLDLCARMSGEERYAGIIVHQPWLSRVFEAVPQGTQKYLFMHDNFAGRAERFEAQNLPRRLAWLSVSEEEQARCMRRADIVFAVQEEELAVFEWQAKRPVIQVKIALDDKTETPFPAGRSRLMVGIVASANENNRVAVEEFVRLWEREPALGAKAELCIAGDIGAFVRSADPSIRILGRVVDLDAFYAGLDLAINPDCGGTGIKVKSLEALSYGRPLLCSPAGGAGLHSTSPEHALPDRAAMIARAALLAERRELLAPLREASVALFHEYRHMDAYLAAFEEQKA